jgi:hypothetical protein
MQKQTLVSYLSFVLSLFSAIAHNLFVGFGIYEIYLFTLALLFGACFAASIIYTIYTYIQYSEPGDAWKLGWLGFFGLAGLVPAFGMVFYGFFCFFALFTLKA